MSAANKAKGSRFENDIVEYIRDNAPLLRAERLARAGSLDEGDVAITFPRGVLVTEAKNHKGLALADWVKQSLTEMVNYVKKRKLPPDSVFPLVVAKRRNHSIGRSYAIMELHMLVELIEYLSGDDGDDG
jgi:hypothetical protein